MVSRTYMIPALVLWFASTTWLVSTKILPTLSAGRPPDYAELFPTSAAAETRPVKWLIRWNDQEIGWAENRISRNEDGGGSITSEVRFEQLPVDQMLKQVLSFVGKFGRASDTEIGPLQLRVLTVLEFDNFAALHRFDTTVDVGELDGLLKIEGLIRDEKLDLTARVGSDGAPLDVLSRKEIRIPPDALVADTFSPRPLLSNLKLGQKWTFQSYRPLMPHSPMELMEASVEQEELLEWSGGMISTRRVVYRRDSGSGLSATRRPTSEIWVAKDGTVLRQDLYLANVRVQFIRVPPAHDVATGTPSVSNDHRHATLSSP